jgi:DegV family protein with EDD domain
MTIKIVTDSGSDLPADIIKEFGISIVPVYVYFGETAYKDGVDISPDELYKRLVESPVYPKTTQPMPNDFAEVYRKLSRETDEIISIHLSAKVSGTVSAAMQGKEMAGVKSRIEIIDSYSLSGGLGLITLAAARAVQSGLNMEGVLAEVQQAIKGIKLYGLLDSLKYLLAGGRITKARAIVGSLLRVRPILTMRQGEIIQFGMARSFGQGLNKLYELIVSAPDIKYVAIVNSTVPNEANELAERVSKVVPREKIMMSRLGAGLGVHGGPGTICVFIQSEIH